MRTAVHLHLDGGNVPEEMTSIRFGNDIAVNVRDCDPFAGLGTEVYLHCATVEDAEALVKAATAAVAMFEAIVVERQQYAANLIHARAADNRVPPDVLEQMLTLAEDEVADGEDPDEVVNRLFREPPAGDEFAARDCAADERYHRDREEVGA